MIIPCSRNFLSSLNDQNTNFGTFLLIKLHAENHGSPPITPQSLQRSPTNHPPIPSLRSATWRSSMYFRSLHSHLPSWVLYCLHLFLSLSFAQLARASCALLVSNIRYLIIFCLFRISLWASSAVSSRSWFRRCVAFACFSSGCPCYLHISFWISSLRCFVYCSFSISRSLVFFSHRWLRFSVSK